MYFYSAHELAVQRNPFGILLLELELCSNSLRDSFSESGFCDEISLGVFSGNGNAIPL